MNSYSRSRMSWKSAVNKYSLLPVITLLLISCMAAPSLAYWPIIQETIIKSASEEPYSCTWIAKTNQDNGGTPSWPGDDTWDYMTRFKIYDDSHSLWTKSLWGPRRANFHSFEGEQNSIHDWSTVIWYEANVPTGKISCSGNPYYDYRVYFLEYDPTCMYRTLNGDGIRSDQWTRSTLFVKRAPNWCGDVWYSPDLRAYQGVYSFWVYKDLWDTVSECLATYMPFDSEFGCVNWRLYVGPQVSAVLDQVGKYHVTAWIELDQDESGYGNDKYRVCYAVCDTHGNWCVGQEPWSYSEPTDLEVGPDDYYYGLPNNRLPEATVGWRQNGTPKMRGFDQDLDPSIVRPKGWYNGPTKPRAKFTLWFSRMSQGPGYQPSVTPATVYLTDISIGTEKDVEHTYLWEVFKVTDPNNPADDEPAELGVDYDRVYGLSDNIRTEAGHCPSGFIRFIRDGMYRIKLTVTLNGVISSYSQMVNFPSGDYPILPPWPQPGILVPPWRPNDPLPPIRVPCPKVPSLPSRELQLHQNGPAGSSLRILASGIPGADISGEVGFDPSTLTLTFTPAVRLQPNTSYTVTVCGGVYEDDTPFEGFSWDFTTGDDIDTAKKALDGASINLYDAIVTAVFYNGSGQQVGFAVEESDRSAGIRVIADTLDKTVFLGDSIDLVGTTATIGGERVIVATERTVKSTGNEIPEPFLIDGKDSAGGAYGAQAAVVNDATSTPLKMSNGVNNIGLLMALRGKVTAVNAEGYFYVDDGYGIHNDDYDFETGLKDGSGNIGVRCRAVYQSDGSRQMPEEGDYVEVTGVMGVAQIENRNARHFWTTSISELPGSSSCTITIFPGKNLLSLPMQPKNPDPAIFGGADYVDGMLIAWDPWRSSSIGYDMWDPARFGTLSTSSGYWLDSISARTSGYEAYPESMLDKWISLGTGDNIVGLPFTNSTYWGSWKANDGTETKTLEEASGYGAGWLCSVGTWWDAERGSSRDLGLPEDYAFTEWMEPGHGYWIRAYKPVALIAPAISEAPAEE